MKGIRKERERLVSLYKTDRVQFNEEKIAIFSEKVRLEGEMYSYDSSDPLLYDFLDDLSEQIFRLSEHLSIYHYIESEMRRDKAMLNSIADDERAWNKMLKLEEKETPSQILARWKTRAVRSGRDVA